MRSCECGFSIENPIYPVYCRCGRILASPGHAVDALANNQPGSELERLIAGDVRLGPFRVNVSALGFKPTGGCGCQTRVGKMDAWGVAGCLLRADEITTWVQESAAAEGIVLPRIFFRKLVDLAIRNASRE